MKVRFVLFASIVLVAGCVSYTAVRPGELKYNGLIVQTNQTWNLAPREVMPSARSDSKVWTQDGILLDRIMFVPSVPSGEALFNSSSRDQALPVFRADMLPNEIEELTESSILKLFGEGDVAVKTTNLRPHRFGDDNGILFDMKVTVSDGPNYRGVIGAFVVADRLYLILYLGAEPYYYDKHLDEALAIIKGAHV